MKNLYLLVCLFLCLNSLSEAQVMNYYQLPTPINGTSANGRGPATQTGYQFHRSSAIYSTIEMQQFLLPGDTIKRLGYVIATAGTSVSGNFRIWMVNTSDQTFLRSTTWTTLLSTPTVMTQVYNSTLTVPATASAYSVLLSTPFIYSGGGMYVAFEWEPSTVGTSTVYSCNYTNILGGQKNGQAATGHQATLANSSDFRPVLNIGVSAPTNDAAIVEVYSMGKLPIPFGTPHIVKANVKNNGGDTLYSKKVYLSVSNTNNFNDSVVIPQLNPGQSITVSFNSYIPTTVGYDTIRAFVAPDNNNSNNSKRYVQLVNLNTYNYANIELPSSGGVGFNGATGDFVAKFPYTGTNSINQIGVNFNTGGNSLKVGIWDTSVIGAPGTKLWESQAFVSVTGLNTIPVNPPIPIGGTFFVGVIQTGTVNAAFSYQAEAPIRGQTFYYTSPTGNTTWTDFLTSSSNFRFMIEPRLSLANDVGVTEIVAPCRAVLIGQQSLVPEAKIYNYGIFNQSNIFAKCRIRDASGAQVYYDSVYVPFIQANQSGNIVFNTAFVPINTGNHSIKIWTDLQNDGDRFNDTASNFIQVYSVPNNSVSSGTRLQFDGVDDNIIIPNKAELNPTTAFTIETWVRPSNDILPQCIYSKDSTFSDTSFNLMLAGLIPKFSLKTNSGSVTLTSSVAVPLFIWTHIAVTYDGSSLKLYVNGDTAGAVTIFGLVANKTGPVYIGRRAGTQYPLNAGLDMLKYWNSPLTQNDIKASMHYKTPTMSSINLMLYYRFDEGTGNSVLVDASGNCNSGIMTNMDINNTTVATWFTSSLPLDTTIGQSVFVSSSGNNVIANKNLALNFYNFSGSGEYVINYFKTPALGFAPDTALTLPGVKTSHDRYWIIYKYGNATFDSVGATFTLRTGNLSPVANINDLYLTRRENGSSALWTIAKNPAYTANSINQTVAFNILSGPTAFNVQYGIAGYNNPLPVKLVSFIGWRDQNDVRLNWTTGSELNNSHFEIERSFDGKDFSQFSKIEGAGNSNKLINYSLVDFDVVSLAKNVIYYRLKQVDLNGKFTYSETIKIDMNQQEQAEIEIKSVQPNPFEDMLQLEFVSKSGLPVDMQLVNINGQILNSRSVISKVGFNSILINESRELPQGIYFLKVNYNNQTLVHKVIKI